MLREEKSQRCIVRSTKYPKKKDLKEEAVAMMTTARQWPCVLS